LSAAGFSLIELLVVLVIAGILSALALPSYRQHVQRGYRAEAAAALLEAQHFMERFYSVNGRYTTDAGGPPALPARLQVMPTSSGGSGGSGGSAARYQLSVAAASVSTYGLQAEPVGAMAGEPCGTLTLTQTGLKGRTGSGLSVSECWR
jgi:type IV pilus assembly protein PilE